MSKSTDTVASEAVHPGELRLGDLVQLETGVAMYLGGTTRPTNNFRFAGRHYTITEARFAPLKDGEPALAETCTKFATRYVRVGHETPPEDSQQ